MTGERNPRDAAEATVQPEAEAGGLPDGHRTVASDDTPEEQLPDVGERPLAHPPPDDGVDRFG